MVPDVRLTDVSREDVERMAVWLHNPEVMTMWYGADDDGEPLHIGYSPKTTMQAGDEEWERIFNDPDRKIFSVYDANEGHIGEAQMLIEAPSARGPALPDYRTPGPLAPPLRLRRPA